MLLFVCGFVGAVHAAAIYGRGSGLPNLAVNALAKDSDGLIWFGTDDGLVRFDGHRFIEVAVTPPGSPADTNVPALLVAPGGMYVATRSRLQFFDFLGAHGEALLSQGRQLANVRALARAADGSNYAVSSDGEIWRWRDDARYAVTTLRAADAQPRLNFLAISAGESGIWLGSAAGAFRLDGAHAELIPVLLDAPTLDNGQREVSSILEYPKGQLWIGYWNDALARVDLASGRHHWYHPGEPGAGALRSTSIYTLAADAAAHQLYIGTNRGLVVYRQDCDCLRGLNLPSWDAAAGIGIIVQSLLPERDGVWAGGFGEGAVRFGTDDAVFQNQVRTAEHADSLAQSAVRALHLGKQGRLWIGTYGGGVQWVDAGDRHPGEPWSMQTLVWDVARAEEKYLWSIEETDDALLISSGAGLLLRRNGRVAALNTPVPSIRCTLKTPHGRQYVGAQSGLYRLDGETLVRLDDSARGGDVAVRSLALHGDELWAGGASGLLRLDGEDRVIAQHAIGGGVDQVPGVVLVQRQGIDGRYWLGTDGGLVEAVDTKDGLRFLRPAALERLRARSIASMEIDRNGRLWLGTTRGLVRYVPQTGVAKRFGQSEGLFGEQFNSGASADDGARLYFGGMGGLVAFDPDALDRPETLLQPALTRLRVGNKDWLKTDHLNLPSGHEALRLEFSAGEFLRPDDVVYALRWSGMDSASTDLGDVSSAVVERLPGGVHVLDLSAARRDQPDSLRVASVLTVVVAYAWYETWWGISVLLLTFVLAVFAFTQLRLRAARAHRQQLAQQVAERTRELSATSAALQQSNAQLQAMALIDPLTGLANRRQLFKQIDLWQRSGVAPAAMMIDLDHFKDCNDRYGHAVGDRVLQAFSALLNDAVPTPNLCARYGGEEFLCLLPDAPAVDVERIASRLLASTRSLTLSLEGGVQLNFTISIGLAEATAGEPIEATIRNADLALYRAKRSRDSYCWLD